MAIRKRKKASKKAEISTASLPDIIFMLLFFFMVVTVMRQSKLLLKVRLPEASEIVKLEHRSLINYIHIGQPYEADNDKQVAIQINDAFITPDKVEGAIRLIRASASEQDRPLLTTSLKIDQKVKMGIITDVKTSLRKAKQLKINYEAIAQTE